MFHFQRWSNLLVLVLAVNACAPFRSASPGPGPDPMIDAGADRQALAEAHAVLVAGLEGVAETSWEAILADESVLLLPGQRLVRGREGIQVSLMPAEGAPDYAGMHIDITGTTVCRTMAWQLGRYQLASTAPEADRPDGAAGPYIAIWDRDASGLWRLRSGAFYTSEGPAPQPPGSCPEAARLAYASRRWEVTLHPRLGIGRSGVARQMESAFAAEGWDKGFMGADQMGPRYPWSTSGRPEEFVSIRYRTATPLGAEAVLGMTPKRTTSGNGGWHGRTNLRYANEYAAVLGVYDFSHLRLGLGPWIGRSHWEWSRRATLYEPQSWSDTSLGVLGSTTISFPLSSRLTGALRAQRWLASGSELEEYNGFPSTTIRPSGTYVGFGIGVRF